MNPLRNNLLVFFSKIKSVNHCRYFPSLNITHIDIDIHQHCQHNYNLNKGVLNVQNYIEEFFVYLRRFAGDAFPQ